MSGEGVQQGLLKMLEGVSMRLPQARTLKLSRGSDITVMELLSSMHDIYVCRSGLRHVLTVYAID